MSIAEDTFWAEMQELFEIFDEAYLFGSGLTTTGPTDIDLLLIYNDVPMSEIVAHRELISKAIFKRFGIEAHLTILSKRENSQIRLTELTNYKKIK